MSKRKTKSRRFAKPSPAAHRHASGSHHSGETRPAEAATVAWTVSVTMVLLCDIGAVAAHFYAQAYPSARGMLMLKELLLFAGAVIGFFSLCLLPMVFRIRRTPPPAGVTVFAVCAAAAPILALLIHNTR